MDDNFSTTRYDAWAIANYTDYDICSILHYPGEKKVENGCSDQFGGYAAGDCSDYCAVTPKVPQPCLIKGQVTYGMGQRLGLSESDIRGINIRYGCKGYG